MLNCGGVIILLSQFEGRKIPCILVARGVREHRNTLTHTAHNEKLFLFATCVLKLVPTVRCMEGDKILMMYILRKDEDFKRTLFPLKVIKVFAHKSLKFTDRDLSFEVSGKIPISFNKFGIAVPPSNIYIC